MTTGLLIDTDPALGIPLSDIDDALAIWFCVRAGLQVAGLTTVFGNAPGEDTFAVGSRLGEAFGVPVFRGADDPADVSTPAVDALVAHRGSVLALGPLTNVASALLRGARWESLVVLGGSNRWLPNLRPLHTTEFNLAMDLGAAALVLPRTDVLFPMEVCREVTFDAEDLAHLPDWLRKRCEHWVRLAPLVTGRLGFHPWDLLPAVWLAHPDLFSFVEASASLRPWRGYRGHVDFTKSPLVRTQVAVHVDAEALRRVWRTTR